MERREALVTGATGGVGTEVLRQLGRQGWSVLGVHRGDAVRAQSARSAWTGSKEKLELRACDLTSEPEVAALYEQMPAEYCPDAVIHIAAPPLTIQPLQRTTWQEVEQQVNGVLKPVVLLTRPLLKRMLHRGHGRIIAVLSMVVVGDPPRGFASYTAAKYALAGYMRSLAVEFAGRGITANTVSPGPMDTAQLSALPDLLREQLRTSTPARTWVDPSEVARTLVWLAADASADITGCNVPLTTGTLPRQIDTESQESR